MKLDVMTMFLIPLERDPRNHRSKTGGRVDGTTLVVDYFIYEIRNFTFLKR